MVEIISKPNGPRREDAAAKHYLRENSATIMKIANHLSGGRLNQNPPVVPSATMPRNARSPAVVRRNEEPRPYASVSLNGRVVVVDFNTGRQLLHLGEIRGRGAGRRFLLATTENHFFEPLDPSLQALLADIDGRPAPDDLALDALVATIDTRLGYSKPGQAT